MQQTHVFWGGSLHLGTVDACSQGSLTHQREGLHNAEYGGRRVQDQALKKNCYLAICWAATMNSLHTEHAGAKSKDSSAGTAGA